MTEQRTEPAMLEELLVVRIVAWRAREMLDACPADSDSTAAYQRAVSAFEVAYDDWASLVRSTGEKKT